MAELDDAVKAVTDRGWGFKLSTDDAGTVEAIIYEKVGEKRTRRIGYATGGRALSMAAVVRLAYARAVKGGTRVDLSLTGHQERE